MDKTESCMHDTKKRKKELSSTDLMDKEEESFVNEGKKEKLESSTQESFEQMLSSIARRCTSYNVQCDEEKEEQEEDIDYGSDHVIPEKEENDDWLLGEGSVSEDSDGSAFNIFTDRWVFSSDSDIDDSYELPKESDLINQYCSVGNSHYIYTVPKSGTKFWFEIFGLCTPVLCVEVKGHRKAYSFFNDEPLPQELHKERKDISLSEIRSQKVLDKMLRDEILRNGVVQLYKNKLSEDVKAELAKIAFAYFRVNSGQ